jgi:3-dehydroquinate synthetase
LVLADPETLLTLPRRELIAGLAEVVKAGLIGDPGLFDLCAQGWQSVSDNIYEVICRSIAVKVNLVQSDPFEHDRRAALNLGHTIGHAIEVSSEYHLLHGEAVAIGLVAEARLAVYIGLSQMGVVDRIEDCLSGLGLPVKIPVGISPDAILKAMTFDKKSSEGTLRFTLPIRPGRDLCTGRGLTNSILEWS